MAGFFLLPCVSQKLPSIYSLPLQPISFAEMPKYFLYTTSSLLLLFFLCFNKIYASPPDSLTVKKDSTQVGFFNNDVERYGILKLHPADTTLAGFENYDPRVKQFRFSASLGNNGQNSRSLLPYPFLRNSGFDYGVHTFDPYLYQNDSVRYYKVFKTFTQLEYVQGAKKEIFFHAKFSRNIYRSLNLGFDFRVMNVPGVYIRQKTNHINFYLTAQYFTKDKRYGVISNFLLNRLANFENGGIKYDSVFEQNLETNRGLYDVNLSSAQNRVRESGFYMKHYFNLSRHPKNANDTTFLTRKHIELGRISYSFEYNRQIQNYMDNEPASGFYHHIYIDSLNTYDSLTVKKIVNEVTWTNPSFRPDKKFRLLQIEAHLKQQYIEVSIHDSRNYLLQYIPSAGFSFNPFSSLHLDAYGDYVFGDFNEGDMSLRVNLSQTLGKANKNAGTISLKAYYAIQKPGWFFERFSGNNFRWDTAWKQQDLISGCFDYIYKKLNTGVSISRINHFVYLDTAATPQQYNNEFGYIYAYLRGELNIWRFTFKGHFAYQTIQGTNVLRLPALLGNVAVYFTQELFHNAATLQPGLNFFYNTLYFGNGYMPATRSFYLQDNKQVGNYLYMDVFINVKIQRARIFIMYSHFNASFMKQNYYMVPGYPMQDAAFKFGVDWRFFD